MPITQDDLPFPQVEILFVRVGRFHRTPYFPLQIQASNLTRHRSNELVDAPERVNRGIVYPRSAERKIRLAGVVHAKR